MIFRFLKPKNREKAMQWIQASALLAFCLGILLPRIFQDQSVISFVSGMFLGYSIPGNLLSIYYHSHWRRNSA
jgi:hypothetical protein